MAFHLAHQAFSTTGKRKSKRKFRNADEARRARENADSWQELLKRHEVERQKSRRARAMAAAQRQHETATEAAAKAREVAEELAKEAQEVDLLNGVKKKLDEYLSATKDIPQTDVVFRVMTWEHIPIDEAKQRKADLKAQEEYDLSIKEP